VKMLIDCVADLHGHYPVLEGGDLLIIGGDLTASDTESQYLEFLLWLAHQNYKKKIFIAGNHDRELQKRHVKLDVKSDCIYLCDSGTEVLTDCKRLKIWGSPWSPLFKGVNPLCTAFMLPEEHLHNKWIQIPQDTDILITHCPPFGTLDYKELSDGTRYHMGSKSLEAWLKWVGRPLVHVFGHIHSAYGIAEDYPTHNDKMMKSINCSLVNDNYKPVNKPIRIEI